MFQVWHIFVDADIGEEEMLRIYDDKFFSGGAYANYLTDAALYRKNFARYITILLEYSAGGRLFEVGYAFGFFWIWIEVFGKSLGSILTGELLLTPTRAWDWM